MWQEYKFDKQTRDSIRLSQTVAVMFNSGRTEIKAGHGKQHLYRNDCSSLIKAYRIV